MGIQLGIAATVFGRNRFLTPADVALLPEVDVFDLEISFLQRRLDYENESYMDDLIEAVQKLHIRVPSVHALAGTEDANASSLNEEKRAWSVNQIKLGADLLARLGGRFLVVHVSHGIDEREDRAMRMDRVAQSLNELVAYCRPRGIVIAVENLPGKRLCNNAPELHTLVEHFRSQDVGICFDTGHANLQGDAVAAFQILRDRIVTFHISDNKGLQDDHALPYVGTLDWTAFMRALQESGYDGVFMYEVGSQKDARQDLSDIRRNFARLLL